AFFIIITPFLYILIVISQPEKNTIGRQCRCPDTVRP
ncbi:unnamed protein product, partial [marine sediment metagenome]